jgi:isocitrate dehydrogenase
MAGKIKVVTPLVEMDGDEMTRIIWKFIKDKLILPFLEIDLRYYDLHVKNRDDTNDKVTVDAANAVKEFKVGVKCATITANDDRVKEYTLKHLLPSPNATIRGILDGTVFRTPILVKNIKPLVTTWKKPITIARHAYGDDYKNTELKIDGPGTAEIVFTPANGGAPIRKVIHQFKGKGIIQGMHNTDESILSFAKSSFSFAYDNKIDMWFSTKDTISKTYDGNFKNIFQAEFEANWKTKFAEAKIEYFYTLIDDVVARIMKTEGNILWACKNYDGDVMSDMLASANGSLAMMTSELVSPNGCWEFEAAHGTVQRHYYNHLKGQETSTNSVASIFAWTGGLRKRGNLDKTPAVVDFANKLEASVLEIIENGLMTGDLLAICEKGPNDKKLSTEKFIDAVAEHLKKKLK